MSEVTIFFFGLLATAFAVGPLSVAFVLELREKRKARENQE